MKKSILMKVWLLAVVSGVGLTLEAGGFDQAQAQGSKDMSKAVETAVGAPKVEKILVDKGTLKNWIKAYDDALDILYKEIKAKNKAIFSLAWMGRDMNYESIIVRENLSLILLFLKLSKEQEKMKEALKKFKKAHDDDTGVCFFPDTKVVMADGTRKDISRVRVGDMVQSYNIEKGILENKKVLKTYTFPSKEYYLINGSVKPTKAHPFLMAGQEEVWKKASELEIGDSVKAPDGQITIRSIKKVKEINTTHNFRVADNRAYIIGEGDERYVVHNGL